MQKVGVAILNYNCSKQLALCLHSLLASTCALPFKAVLVENASRDDEREAAKAVFDRFCEARGQDDVYVNSERNLGFAGGNNLAARELLADEAVTHLCFLNADTVVSDHWLDTLVACGSDLAGPVSNAGGGIQTVFCDRQPEQTLEAVGEVLDIARQRKSLFAGLRCETDMLSFFAVVVTRAAFETIGFLDERFFPGTFEDDDYSLRAVQKGMTLTVARDCYVHHWGESSFAQLDNGNTVFLDNLRRFEEKWNVKHAGREWKIYESARIDSGHALHGKASPLVMAQIDGALEYAKQDRAALMDFYTKRLEREKVGGYDEIPLREIPKQMAHKIKRLFRNRRG